MDLYQYAHQTEKSGAQFYQHMAGRATKEGLKRVFKLMAGEEERLLDKLSKFRKHFPEIGDVSCRSLNKDTIVFDSICDNGVCDLIESDLDAYQLAIRAKRNLIRRYREAAEQEPHAATRKLLIWLEAMEKHQLDEIEQLYDFANAPNLSLEWAEFSNLDEFYNFGYYEDLRSGDPAI